MGVEVGGEGSGVFVAGCVVALGNGLVEVEVARGRVALGCGGVEVAGGVVGVWVGTVVTVASGGVGVS